CPVTHGQDHADRHKQTQRCRRLDKARVETTARSGSVLSNVGCGTTVFTSKGEALQQAEYEHQNRREHAQCFVPGNEAYCERGSPHDNKGDEEGMLSANEVSKTSEYQGTKRPHNKSGTKG